MSLAFILIPLIASALVFALRGTTGRPVALIAALANLAVTLWCCLSCDHGSMNCTMDLPWVPAAGISFSIGMDGITTLMLLLTNLVAPLIVLSSFNRQFDNEPRYYGLLLLMLAALNGVFLARDGMLFYVFYELALIPIYFICAIWGGENRIRITLKFFIYTFIGSLFMLVALLYLYMKAGVRSFDWNALTAAQLSTTEAVWISLGFFLAFAVKMPVFPFHTWQPDTYVTAPTGGTMLLSGIMLKMGAYGAIRWMMPMTHETAVAPINPVPVFVLLSVIGIIYASVIAVKQTDLKRLIAYSSIAHVGLIAAGIFVWNKPGLQGSLIQMLNHGINVVGLFYVADLLERRLETRTLRDMGGIAKSAPRLAALFMIIVLGSVAVPLTNGFTGEFLLLNGVWNYNATMGAVAGLTIIFGAVYMLRAYGLVMFGPANEHNEEVADTDRHETLILGSIAALVLLFGFFPNALLQLTNASADHLLGKF